MPRRRQFEAFGGRAVVVDEARQTAVGEPDRLERNRVADEGDLIAETVLEVDALDANAVFPERLFEADVEVTRTFWFQRGVAQEEPVGAEDFLERRSLDAFAVIDAQPRRTAAALQTGLTDYQNRPKLRHDFRAKSDFAGVGRRA